MRYNPEINCAAYSRASLEKRLEVLEVEQAGARKGQAPRREREMQRISAFLQGPTPAPETPTPETPDERRKRIYPSQMSTPVKPDAPFVRAIVGPNRTSSAALSYGFQG